MADYLPEISRIEYYAKVSGADYYRTAYYSRAIENIIYLTIQRVTWNYDVVYKMIDDKDRVITGKLIIESNGQPKKVTCNCLHQKNGKFCGHLLILVRYLNVSHFKVPHHYVEEGTEDLERFIQERRERKWLEMKERSSKHWLASLYQSSLESLRAKPSQKLRLVPVLDLDYDACLSFKIGADRLYKIKNLNTQLLRVLDTGEVVRFGKFLEQPLELAQFDDFSQKIIAFIQRSISRTIFNLESFIPIDGDNLADFIETFKDCPDLTFQPVDIQIKLDVSEVLGNRIEVNIGEAHGVNTEKACFVCPTYFLQSQGDNRFSYAPFNQIDWQLFDTLTRNGEMVFSQTDFAYFKDKILAQSEIFEWMALDTVEEELTSTTVVSATEAASSALFSIYLDLTDEEDLLVRLESQVGGDWQREAFKSLIQEEFKANETDVGLLISDENNKMDFLESALPNLNKVAKVYVSDLIKTISKPKALNFSIGVSVNQGGLNLVFDSPDLDLKELGQILKSYRRKRRFHRLKNGERIAIHDQQFQELDTFLSDMNLDELPTRKRQVPAYRMYQLQELAPDYINVDFDKKFQEMFEQPAPAIAPKYENVLRAYQTKGVDWLLKLRTMGLAGILADDMGLGKSLQMIAYFESVVAKSKRPSLIVVPASLIYNWEAEFAKFGSQLNPVLVSGSKEERRVALKEHRASNTIFITSYDYLRRDEALYEKLAFDTVVLDEAHYIKNQRTKTARAVKELEASHRFALTGTPIENSLAELWSIFDFLMPGYLYPYGQFSTNYEKPIVKEQDDAKRQKLQDLVSPFILRRLKQEVLTELPEKIEEVYYVGQTDEERKLYQANLALMNKELAADMDIKQSSVQILAMLTRLRQLALDPRLLFDNIDAPSSKIEATVSLLQEAKESGQPVLVFSAFTSALDLLEEACQKEGLSYLKLTGSTPKEQRKRYVEQFQKGRTNVFLISLKAGGTGLNLTAASIVIHLDPWWNISAQNQATDRAYRIGQKNAVQVYKMVTKQTIDEKIQQLQAAKQSLSDDFVETATGTISQMSESEIRNLFKAD